MQDRRVKDSIKPAIQNQNGQSKPQKSVAFKNDRQKDRNVDIRLSGDDFELAGNYKPGKN